MFRFIILIGIVLLLFIPLYRFIRFCVVYFMDEISDKNNNLSSEYKNAKNKMKSIIDDINEEIDYLDSEKQKLENIRKK